MRFPLLAAANIRAAPGEAPATLLACLVQPPAVNHPHVTETTLTRTYTDRKLAEAKVAYQEKLRATWKLLHDDAEQDFERGFRAGLNPEAVLSEAVTVFEIETIDHPMQDLRVEDFTGGFRAARA